jgi:hypothetical protein
MQPSALDNLMPNVPVLPPGSSSFAVDAIKFSFYVLSVTGFLTIVVSGLVVLRTQYALQSIPNNSVVPALNRRKSNIHKKTDTERALNQHDLEATAIMRRARPFALFGPLPSAITMIAVPVSLHLNRVGDLGFRVLLSILLIAVIHCANACTLHTYFSLIEEERTISFGSDVCSAREEKRRCRNLVIYFTVLFALSFVKTNEKNDDADATEGWEPASAYSPLPFRIARLSQDLSDLEPHAGGELERLA